MTAPKWRNCGHPKTPENTQRIGKAGDRCRTCRRKIALRYWNETGAGKRQKNREAAKKVLDS